MVAEPRSVEGLPAAWSGRSVVVTGGTSGIGLAIAEAFLNAGTRVIVTGRSEARGADALALLAPHGEAHFVAGDAGTEAAADTLKSRATALLGGVDTLVCAAGLNRRSPPEDLTLADWDAVLDANLKAVFLSCRALHPLLRDSGDGRIITLGSMLSVLANEASSAYAAAKGGVVQFTRSMAVSWAEDGIRANTVLPGWVDTPFNDPFTRQMGGRDALEGYVREQIPMGRWASADEIAEALLFLASDRSSFMTGQALVIDGGECLG